MRDISLATNISMLMLIWFMIQIQDLFTGMSTTAACRIGSKCKKMG